MEKLGEFLAMGGHAAFIWPSFALAALIMVTLLIVSLRGLRARQASLEALQQARPGRSGAGERHDEA